MEMFFSALVLCDLWIKYWKKITFRDIFLQCLKTGMFYLSVRQNIRFFRIIGA